MLEYVGKVIRRFYRGWCVCVGVCVCVFVFSVREKNGILCVSTILCLSNKARRRVGLLHFRLLCGTSSPSLPAHNSSAPCLMATGKRVLIVTTSHDKLGDTDMPTGLWAEEAAAPFYILKEAGAHVDIVSIKGGKIPLDPASLEGDLNEHTQAFLSNRYELKTKMENSRSIDEVSEEYDAIYLPGGHGVCYDFPDNPKLIALVEKFWAQGKVVASVCHGPSGLVNMKAPDGEYIVKGKRVTGFTNSEEDAVGRTLYVPFLLEDMLKERGGLFERGNDWTPYAVADGKLITGQNPMSSVMVAKLILSAL